MKRILLFIAVCLLTFNGIAQSDNNAIKQFYRTIQGTYQGQINDSTSVTLHFAPIWEREENPFRWFYLEAVNNETKQIVAQNILEIEPISDIIGLQIAAALKNVLAIGCGILYGRNLGQNASAQFMVEGIQEMMLISQTLGGSAETFSKVGALGDIILTCTSLQSRNMTFGKFLADGGSIATWHGALAEGIFASKFIPNLNCSCKIFQKIYQVIYGQIAVEEFLKLVL